MTIESLRKVLRAALGIGVVAWLTSPLSLRAGGAAIAGGSPLGDVRRDVGHVAWVVPSHAVAPASPPALKVPPAEALPHLAAPTPQAAAH